MNQSTVILNKTTAMHQHMDEVHSYLALILICVLVIITIPSVLFVQVYFPNVAGHMRGYYTHVTAQAAAPPDNFGQYSGDKSSETIDLCAKPRGTEQLTFERERKEVKEFEDFLESEP